MNRIEIKTKAKQQLGNNIFGNNWLFALLVLLIQSLILTVCGATALGIIGAVGLLLLTGPIEYGVQALFLKQTRDGEKMDVAGMFAGFKDDFGGTFLICLLTGIFTLLWSLLFVIPGIIKGYSYSMAYLIKKDHPEYSASQCINESKVIMHGHKWELFVLDLSFIGWWIVGGLCLGIGTLWVAPYVKAAHTQFYNALVSQG